MKDFDAFEQSPPGTLALYKRGNDMRSRWDLAVIVMREAGDDYRDLFVRGWDDTDWTPHNGAPWYVSALLKQRNNPDVSLALITEDHPMHDEAHRLAAEWALGLTTGD